MTRRPRPPLIAALVCAVLVIGACTATPGSPSGSGPASPVASDTVPASPVPSATTGASGGVVEGAPGVTPIPIGPGGPGSTPGPVGAQPPQTVTPVAGLLDVRDVRAESFTVDGSSGTIRVTIVWWSGPAPCSQLSEVRVVRSDTSAGSTFTLSVREGAAQLGVACPAIAVHKQTTVDLGPIRDQNWTIAVTGVDQPQTIHMGA
jgi:hypothetical protein